MNDAQREMTLDEWMARLSPFHAARKEYDAFAARLAEKDAALTQCRGLLKQNVDAVEHYRARLAKAERDAARYQWLRSVPAQQSPILVAAAIKSNVTTVLVGNELDKAIDAATAVSASDRETDAHG
jgi:hypothetical protein